MKLLYQGNHGFVLSHRVNKLDYPLHIHNAVEIFLFTRGESTVCFGEEVVRLSHGDAFVSFPNQVHGYCDSTDVEGYLFIIPVRPHLSPFYATLTQKVPICPYIKRGQWDAEQLIYLAEQAYNDLPRVSETVMQGYLLVIFGKLLEALALEDVSKGSEEALRATIQYLGSHYKEPLTRKMVAAAVGYHESYISHIFSQKLKTSLPEYINGLRVYDASRLLLETEMPIADIAMSLGFGSIRNFNRVFLKETGRSPKDYRSAAGEEQ